MIGYLIVIAEITDRGRFADYVQALPPVYGQFGGQYLVVSGPSQVQRFGAAAEKSIVISEWSSLEQIRAFWYSDAYQAVAKKRTGTGLFQVAAISGIAQARSFAASAICLSFPAIAAIGNVLATGDVEWLEGQPIAEQLCLQLIENTQQIDTLALAPGDHWLVNPLPRA